MIFLDLMFYGIWIKIEFQKEKVSHLMSEPKKHSIRDIPIPDNLSTVEKAEYTAYQEAMGELEDEWEALQKGENINQKECIALLEQIKEKRRQQADERMKLRLEVIDKQVEREKERINQEHEEACKALFERIVRAYRDSYNMLVSQLKEIMPKDEYSAFISQHSIEFPTISNESQFKTRMPQLEEPKNRVNAQEAEQDLRFIQSKLQEASSK